MTQQDVVRALQGAGKSYPQVTAVVTLPIPEEGGVVEKVAELVLVGVDAAIVVADNGRSHLRR